MRQAKKSLIQSYAFQYQHSSSRLPRVVGIETLVPVWDMFGLSVEQRGGFRRSPSI